MLGTTVWTSSSGFEYCSNLYVLNNNYSRFIGKVVYPYTAVGSQKEGNIIFYSVENDGTKTEIANYDLKQTEDPIDIDVNLKGVVNLEIKITENNLALYDASFLAE